MEAINIEEIEALDIEVKRIIAELQAEKDKNQVLMTENNQLRQKVTETDQYRHKAEQLAHEVRHLKTQGQSNISELNSQDISEIMVAAKVAANQMVKKAEKEARDYELTKRAALETVKAEADVFQTNLLKVKAQIENDLTAWMTRIDEIAQVPTSTEQEH
ncbi:hypothetical protein C0213_02975 [Latilactobacillus sakei]|nr:hypothetical protein [Latilactobacillus sakei]AUX11409.1 hypothetical protein C0213_02975 [Latilactobacillus sakei]